MWLFVITAYHLRARHAWRRAVNPLQTLMKYVFSALYLYKHTALVLCCNLILYNRAEEEEVSKGPGARLLSC